MSLSQNLDDLIEAYAADDCISDNQVDLLRSTVEGALQEPGGIPMIAGSHQCQELDLPQGSTCPEVAAALLDALEKNANNDWLNATRDHFEIELAA